MDAEYYTTIFREALLSAENKAMGDSWTLQQENTSLRTAQHSQVYLENKDLHVLDWSACFVDLNIFEMVWDFVVREMHKDGKRYGNKEVLDDVLFYLFLNLSTEYNHKLYCPFLCHWVIFLDDKDSTIDFDDNTFRFTNLNAIQILRHVL